MKKQLSDLHMLLKFLDPDLCNHLGTRLDMHTVKLAKRVMLLGLIDGIHPSYMLHFLMLV